MTDTLDLPGGPAFPISIAGYGDNGCYGMSLRDWFAGQASVIMIGYHTGNDGICEVDAAAAASYALADAMLRARRS